MDNTINDTLSIGMLRVADAITQFDVDVVESTPTDFDTFDTHHRQCVVYSFDDNV